MAGGLVLGVVSVRAQLPYEQVLAFGMGDWLCRRPCGSLVEVSEGYLYGTTSSGGRGGGGAIFRLSLDATELQILHHFDYILGTGRDGKSPKAGPTLGEDDYLYGTTEKGGEFGFGTVFRIKADGSDYSVLHDFIAEDGDGIYPLAELILGDDDWLYGTTAGEYLGWYLAPGTVFRVRTNGTGFGVLHTFDTEQDVHGRAQGSMASLLFADDGYLYGTTFNGGDQQEGTVFRLFADGTGYETLHSFDSSAGESVNPEVGLVLDATGYLYGMTSGGAGFMKPPGTVYRIRTDGTEFEVLHVMASNRLFPAGPLMLTPEGVLFGSATERDNYSYPLSGQVFRLRTDGTDFAELHAFVGANWVYGSGPQGGLLQGRDGRLYGNTWRGGAENSGTVFALAIDGTEYEVVWHFLEKDD